MELGRMNKVVHLQRAVRVPVADGFEETWTTYATVRAAVEPATPRSLETLTSATITSPVSHLVTMPFSEFVQPSDRVWFSDHYAARAIYIAGIQNLHADNRWLVLAGEERGA